MGTAQHVPKALLCLAQASTKEEAQAAYWRIDNTVIVQGYLYESALPTVVCAVTLLDRCSSFGRPWLLELLVQIGGGEPNRTELELSSDLRQRCLQEIKKGFAVYLSLLECGDLSEVGLCVDLVGLCVQQDSAIKEQVRWYLERTLQRVDLHQGVKALVTNWLQDESLLME